MIFKKTKSGNNEGSATRRIQKSEGNGWHGATQLMGSDTDAEKTVLMHGDLSNGPSKQHNSSAAGQDKTMVYRGDIQGSATTDTEADLPVGWLIIINGPGKGAARPLGYGHNSLGRDAAQRISIDFGDSAISRQNHAAIIYDGKNRKFYLSHGEGHNLVYIEDKPVLEPTEIGAYSRFTIGKTTLLLLPLCNAEFDWD